MRIIAGIMKGATLHLPKSNETRPLKDLARESIFNLLKHSNKILFKFEKSNILDLYAGTGSFGLECLSRQAKNVCFVENKKEALVILKKNIEKLKIKNKIKIFSNDVLNVIEKKNFFQFKFDLVFCDPPFKNNDIEKIIELIASKNILKKDGIIVIHRNKKSNNKFPKIFNMVDERIYGISKIIFGKLLS